MVIIETSELSSSWSDKSRCIPLDVYATAAFANPAPILSARSNPVAPAANSFLLPSGNLTTIFPILFFHQYLLWLHSFYSIHP